MTNIESIIQDIKNDFPTFQYFKENDAPLCYLDNAATTFKPQIVIDKMREYYVQYPSNIHRGTYAISQRASYEYELSKTKVARFINAESSENIVFTSGSTASSNLFSRSFAKDHLQAGDEIILSIMEHHSHLLNWKELSDSIGFTIKYIEFKKDVLELDIDSFKGLFTNKTKLLAMTHISNTLGIINKIEDFIAIAKEKNVPVCIDMAQSISHIPIDVQSLNVDFAFFSGHKMFGPTGIGVFYYKSKWAQLLSPFFYGGGMIAYIENDKMVFRDAPERFEAGTPPIAEAIALGSSIDYILSIGFSTIQKIDAYLSSILLGELKKIPFLNLLLSPNHSLPLVSFNIDGVHSHDAASILEDDHVSVRVGKHCTEPLMNFLKLSSTIRVSLSIYNTTEDIQKLVESIKHVKEIF